MNLVDIFKERYSFLTDNPDEFASFLQQPLKKSFRVNTLLTSIDEIKERFSDYGISIEEIPWYDEAFITTSEASSSIEHALGMIYFQELTSMLPCIALENDLQDAQTVMDACAAPGSKTTHAAALMKNKGTIIANDISYQRLRALKFNLEKSGVLNAIITNKDLLAFPAMKFDVVLLDAPCSSEGMLRKKMGILERWSLQRIAQCAALQKKLILKAFDMLNDDGVMMYSTCTFAPEENEAVVSFLLEHRDAVIENIEIPHLKSSSGIEEWNGIVFDERVKNSVRIWPHQNDTGGFFMAKISRR